VCVCEVQTAYINWFILH